MFPGLSLIWVLLQGYFLSSTAGCRGLDARCWGGLRPLPRRNGLVLVLPPWTREPIADPANEYQPRCPCGSRLA